jgi:LacI family transcriptional regulator
MIKKSTIYDIAKAANTSVATVSRVLSNTDYPVKTELRERVLKEAKRLKYIPNLIGRQLKSKISNDIGVIIPNITNPFYSQLILGVEHIARKNGYNVMLCNSQRNPLNEKSFIESLIQKQVQGIIISSLEKNNNILELLKMSSFKIVVMDQDVDIDCSKIIFNFKRGGFLAAKHLVDLGHKEIAFVSAPLSIHSRVEVYEGFIKYFKSSGLEMNENYVFISEEEKEFSDEIYEFENGKALAKKILSNDTLPTSVFCINDMTAIGVIQELKRNKIRIPEDISVVGFDNIPLSQITIPPLTTIDQSTYKMGVTAAEVLLNKIEEKDGDNVSISFEPSLIVRDSTKKYEYKMNWTANNESN